jgi:N-acetylneuraminic acid mutarotase
MRITKLFPAACATALLVACQASTGPGPEPRPADPTATGLSELAASNSWSTRAPMPFGRTALSAAANNGVLYAVGGGIRDQSGGVRATTNLQAYDIQTNTWSALRPVPVLWGWGNGASFLNGRLYISGGNLSKALFVYDPATNRWTRKADMPHAMQLGSQGVIAGQLYVYDGSTPGAGALLGYNPATNTWTKRASPPPLHGQAAAAGVIGGKFYVAGGQEQYSPMPTCTPTIR